MDSGRRNGRRDGGGENEDGDAPFVADAGALDEVLQAEPSEQGARAGAKRRLRRAALRGADGAEPRSKGESRGRARARRGKDDDQDEAEDRGGRDGGAQGARASGGALTVAPGRSLRTGHDPEEDELVEAEPAARPSLVLEMTDPGLERRLRRKAFWGRVRLWLSFLLLVAAPSVGAAWYLFQEAADQYASRVSFAVRSLDGASSAPITDLLLGGGADSTSGDSQMLFEYLQSQPLVAAVDARLDLREIYNRPEGDLLFSLGEAPAVEDLVEYWARAVTVAYDSTAGIIHVEVKAFRPQDAQAVSAAVLDESERLINGLSTGARQDAVRFARVDLDEAEARVRDARMALQDFRARQGTADVSSDIVQEMTLIASLRAQRSEVQSDYDSRAAGALSPESPVLAALQRRLDSLDAQIVEAEARIAVRGGEDGGPAVGDGADGDGANGAAAGAALAGSAGGALVDAAGRQEELQVELEFATNMYTAAQTALEGARAEARRAQRYLATHIAPTLSDEAEYPQRLTWSLTIFSLLLVGWSILLLISSSIRDRS